MNLHFYQRSGQVTTDMSQYDAFCYSCQSAKGHNVTTGEGPGSDLSLVQIVHGAALRKARTSLMRTWDN